MSERHGSTHKARDEVADSRFCRDLADRGLNPADARKIAERMALAADGLSPDQYAVALDAAVAAFESMNDEAVAVAEAGRRIDEIQRMMQGFAGELRKLEEGLRTLSAYAQRMRSQTSGDDPDTLH
jgi:hypothetical protein